MTIRPVQLTKTTVWSMFSSVVSWRDLHDCRRLRPPQAAETGLDLATPSLLRNGSRKNAQAPGQRALTVRCLECCHPRHRFDQQASCSYPRGTVFFSRQNNSLGVRNRKHTLRGNNTFLRIITFAFACLSASQRMKMYAVIGAARLIYLHSGRRRCLINRRGELDMPLR